MEKLFNELLLDAGINPKQTALLRHKTKPGRGGQSLYDLWRKDRKNFELYQSTQTADQPIFRNTRYWASFVSTPQGETLFAGLYEASFIQKKAVNWVCPYEGTIPGQGAPVDIFNTVLLNELSEEIGKLRIAWDFNNVRTWARYAHKAPFSVISENLSSTQNLSLSSNLLLSYLISSGFKELHKTSKVYSLHKDNIVVYVKRNSNRLPLVVHPRYFDIEAKISSLSHVKTDLRYQRYINSNLKEFPIFHSANASSPSHFGMALGVSRSSLPFLLDLLEKEAKFDTEAGSLRLFGTINKPLTERERLTLARIGQGDFRSALIEIWNKKCPVSGVDQLELLRASHIKPWSDSSDLERLDPFNGILLAAHIDLLFDNGLISFNNDGSLLISNKITKDNLNRLGIFPEMNIKTFGDRHRQYLNFHRESIFLK